MHENHLKVIYKIENNHKIITLLFHFGHLNDQQLYDQKSTCAKPIEQSLCGFAFITFDCNLISFINFRQTHSLEYFISGSKIKFLNIQMEI